MSRACMLVVVGDALLDRDVEGRVERLSPDAPVPVLDQDSSDSRPGGAGLAAVLAAADGCAVTLVTALARDEAGAELARLLRDRGVDTIDLGLGGSTPEKVRVRTGGRSLLRIDRGVGEPESVGAPGQAALSALASADAVLVSDYGLGVAAEPALRDALGRLSGHTPIVWDPHPRGPAPVAGIAVATPNAQEVGRLAHGLGDTGVAAAASGGESVLGRWGTQALCVTRGAEGALLVRRGQAPMVVPAPEVRGGDPCGAGDRFASRLALELAAGAALEDAVPGAVACASMFVAAGGAGAAGRRAQAAAVADGGGRARIDGVRAAGGTVVATGGCFDLLHAGHVRTLEAARRLGDCLVVCLNSDASVRRLKGADRPLVPDEDRAAVLEALGCVDAVRIFDEDTPERVLEELRPDLWVKGGDYTDTDLPETGVLQRWGGRCVLLPYVEGRSTTRLIQEAASRVAN